MEARLGDETFEFVRETRLEPPRTPSPTKPFPATPVRAPAPGVVRLQTERGARVAEDEVVGSVQAHGRRVPVTCAVSGVVEQLHVSDGDFVEYGQEVLEIGNG